MKRKRKPDDPVPVPIPAKAGTAGIDPVVREALIRAAGLVKEAGGVVLAGHGGRPFAFYPPRAGHVHDLCAPGRLREAVERRLEELAA